MGIVLRWREEPFDCEFRDTRGGGMLNVYVDGQTAWREPAASAAVAYTRARELRDVLAPRGAKLA
jgi:hypothetical protein